MRALYAILTVLMLMAPATAAAEAEPPSDATIIAMAQAFMLEHYRLQRKNS